MVGTSKLKRRIVYYPCSYALQHRIHPLRMSTSLDSTYGVWLVSLFLETLLYGMGVLQTWIYFASRPTDSVACRRYTKTMFQCLYNTQRLTGPCCLVRLLFL
jgi:hypothetical protein